MRRLAEKAWRPSGRHGDWWAWFGGSSVGDMSWITQSLVITTGLTAELNFWLWVSKAATSGGDYLRVYVDATPIYTADVGTQTNSYMPASIPLDVYADGHPHILRFESQTAGYSNFNVDDVAVDVSGNITLICQNDTLPWVSTTPLSGTIAADSYNVLNVQFDATGLTSGTRTGTLCLNTSDAARPQLAIPVMLTIQRQNMTIVKSGPAAAFAGNPITYTIAYTNAGDAEASGVIIVDTLPVNVTAAATTTWNIGTVAPGASGTIVLTATVDSAVISGTVAANTATVFSADDLDLGNNTGSVTTRIVEFYRIYLPLIRR